MSPIRLLVGWGIFRLEKEVIIGGADPMKTTFVGRVTQKPNKTRAFGGCYEELGRFVVRTYECRMRPCGAFSSCF